MAKKKKIIINLVGGPGTGKSLYSSYLFTMLKINGKNVEFTQEYAKDLVWRKKYEILRNQHIVSYHQYQALKGASKYVEAAITDGSLIHSYYYNRHSDVNYSNVDLTEERIQEYYKKFDNIVILLKRNPKYPYQQEGRYQTEEEAKEIDDRMKDILKEKKIKYIEIMADMDNTDEMLNYIIQELDKIKIKRLAKKNKKNKKNKK